MNENQNPTAEVAQQATAQEPTAQSTTDNTQAAQAESTQATQQPERTFTQEEVNRMIADRLSRERRQHQQEIETARNEGRTQAEELARMTQEQREQHEREQAAQQARQREEQLLQRERAVSERELRAQAIDTLASRDLPRGLANVLDYSSADACNASIATVEREFRAAVQQGVDARLRASGVSIPAPGSQPDYARMSDADYYAATLKK